MKKIIQDTDSAMKCLCFRALSDNRPSDNL